MPFSYKRQNGSPGYSPSDTTSARSPLAVLFCSAPPLGCGSVHVLDGSFARFCVSENVRVPLRYSGQPLHRKIIASRSPNTPWFCLSNRFFASFNQAINRKSIYADIRQPENNASNQSARVCLQTVRVFHTSGKMVPPQYSPSHAARSFTIRDRAKCPRRRARSFDEGVIVSRPNAVGRDVIVTLYTKSYCSF